MGRGRREWTQAKYERYLREGRGQGRGINYHPWMTIQDFPSKCNQIIKLESKQKS